jgi:excisionase family DNA binding protein
VSDAERLLTAREVAELIGVSTSTFLDWWEAGRVPGFRLGGKGGPVRFRLSEVLAWIETKRRGRSPDAFASSRRPEVASTVSDGSDHYERNA